MITLPTPEVPISDKDYYHIAMNTLKSYADDNVKGKLFWKNIKIDFKNWIKKQ